METRTCKLCHTKKDITSFPRHSNKPDGTFYRKHACNTCISRRFKSKPEGREAVQRIAKKCKQVYRERVPAMKVQLMQDIGQTCCKVCKIDNPIVLCFHHRDRKEKSFGISWAFTHSYAYETLLTEAKKCDVLCANCHLILHATEGHAS